MADVIKQLDVVVDGGSVATIEFDATKLDGKDGIAFELVANKGQANGYASLDASGHVPSTQLPSYVDDVLEYPSKGSFPATGETGKIYVALDTLRCYRWGGSTYAEISESLALGETATTAFDGERGKFAYDHALDGHNKAVTTDQTSATLQRVKVSNEGHVIGVETAPFGYQDTSVQTNHSTGTLIGTLNLNGQEIQINMPIYVANGVLYANNTESNKRERVLTETDLSWHEF